MSSVNKLETASKPRDLHFEFEAVDGGRSADRWSFPADELTVTGRRPMKCKLHPYELGVGVCASCLSERLLAAQNELSATHDRICYDGRGHQLRCLRSELLPLEAPPAPLAFPRSVSPYVGHRRSVGSDASAAGFRRQEHFQRFFSTPQVGPTFEGCSDIYGDADDGRRKSSGKFSILKTILGRRRSEQDPYLHASKSSRSRSWFSALIRGRRKKEKRQFSVAEELDVSCGKSRRPWRPPERGISPDIQDYEEKDEGSGYSTDSSTGRRPMPTPMRSFPANHRHRGSLGEVSGFAVCPSPLVRAGPSGPRSQAAEAGVSGDARASPSGGGRREALADVAPLGPNQSWSVAGFGWFR